MGKTCKSQKRALAVVAIVQLVGTGVNQAAPPDHVAEF